MAFLLQIGYWNLLKGESVGHGQSSHRAHILLLERKEDTHSSYKEKIVFHHPCCPDSQWHAGWPRYHLFDKEKKDTLQFYYHNFCFNS